MPKKKKKNQVSPSSSTSTSIEESYSSETIETLFDVIYCGLNVNKDNHCIGERDQSSKYFNYNWITYSQLVRESQYFAKGLQQLGLTHGQDTKIGIYVNNSIQVSINVNNIFPSLF